MDRLLETGLDIDLVDKVIFLSITLELVEFVKYCLLLWELRLAKIYQYIMLLRSHMNFFHKQDGLTALHHAIIGKKEPVISHLLRKGANPHVRDLVREFWQCSSGPLLIFLFESN